MRQWGIWNPEALGNPLEPPETIIYGIVEEFVNYKLLIGMTTWQGNAHVSAPFWDVSVLSCPFKCSEALLDLFLASHRKRRSRLRLNNRASITALFKISLYFFWYGSIIFEGPRWPTLLVPLNTSPCQATSWRPECKDFFHPTPLQWTPAAAACQWWKRTWI